jgi:hypothetical protein
MKSLKIAVLWDVTQCSLVEMYRRFRRSYYPHHQDLLKRRGISTGQHGVTSQKTAASIVTTPRTSVLTDTLSIYLLSWQQQQQLSEAAL